MRKKNCFWLILSVFVARWSVVFLYRLVFENKKKLRNDIAKIFQTNKIVMIFKKKWWKGNVSFVSNNDFMNI